MDWLSATSTIDLDAIMKGSDSPAPLTDVSWSSPAMESYTPTGTGSGQFIDTQTQNTLLGGLTSVLNYALQRDAIKIQASTQQQLAGNQVGYANSALAYQAQQSNSNRTLIMLGLGVAAVFLVMRG